MRVLLSSMAIFIYLLFMALLMYANTAYFQWGDPALGPQGWQIYWFIWSLVYLPVLLYGMTLNSIKNKKPKDLIKCNSVLTLVLLIFAEISFVNDLSWLFIIIQYLFLGVAWIYVLKLKMYLNKRFP